MTQTFTFTGFDVIVEDATMTGYVNTTAQCLDSELKEAIKDACFNLKLHQHQVEINHGYMVDRVFLYTIPYQACECHYDGFKGEYRWMGFAGKVRAGVCKKCFDHKQSHLQDWDPRKQLVWEELEVVPEEVKTR